jgi:colanic acid biosynthesis glycosyl transferase WcaI
MASARPVIAAVDPGSDAWNLVEEGECGLCIEPENARALAEGIQMLTLNRSLRERLGRNGREHVVRHYTRQAIGCQYHRLLTSLFRPG